MMISWLDLFRNLMHVSESRWARNWKKEILFWTEALFPILVLRLILCLCHCECFKVTLLMYGNGVNFLEVLVAKK